MTKFKPEARKITATAALVIMITGSVLYYLEHKLLVAYRDLESATIIDRSGEPLKISPNSKGYYSAYLTELPSRFTELLLAKEDRWFYYHLGVNPGSIARALYTYTKTRQNPGSSTITQQLVKNLLHQEQERSIVNKFEELAYTLAAELFLTKKEILVMYANTAYLGNQVQGFGQASEAYFHKPIEELTDQEIISLLATLSSPSTQNPRLAKNQTVSKKLAANLGVNFDQVTLAEEAKLTTYKPTATNQKINSFELDWLNLDCVGTCQSTIDQELTDKLREVLKRNLNHLVGTGADNGAIVVIKVPENELLAIIGSADPKSLEDGHQINMAILPRPIGSTIKPFIYLQGFAAGLRPYTLVNDREYKYQVASGHPIYPKNYDGTYRGIVSLEEALANSLNVPSVKTLEHIGLKDFYDFLEHDLHFKPIQDLSSYEYGIALGGLEMDLLSLSHLFTIFPNQGQLKPLHWQDQQVINQAPMLNIDQESEVAKPEQIAMVTKILNNRQIGVEQFGLNSNLNLTNKNYAVKTGTSRDYHDSWTVGYTPDFVVGVWVGNAKNTPLKQVSGQSGAGRIWHEAMQLVLTSKYATDKNLDFSTLEPIRIDGRIFYGLPNDQINYHRNLLAEKSLILSPHHGDKILLDQNTNISLKASESVTWLINGNHFSSGTTTDFKPTTLGSVIITAKGVNRSESITLEVMSKN